MKTELEMVDYATPGDALRKLTEYVRYYNVQHRHSSLGFKTPEEFETSTAVTK